ncbi:hypothetical protein BD410DRAFT_787874 [Rickenella mellea]|uniref:Uncharacterized protein n=1 Tax=Rickenella mellea TaxID=50990 RepID=A0A4Y7Q6I4_9AGAM|nr:hypothetical protein BD410DRAFT_787874 [Rickenella mellea]
MSPVSLMHRSAVSLISTTWVNAFYRISPECIAQSLRVGPCGLRGERWRYGAAPKMLLSCYVCTAGLDGTLASEIWYISVPTLPLRPKLSSSFVCGKKKWNTSLWSQSLMSARHLLVFSG